MARTGCSLTAVLGPLQEAVGEPLCLSRCGDELKSAVGSDIFSLPLSVNKLFM